MGIGLSVRRFKTPRLPGLDEPKDGCDWGDCPWETLPKPSSVNGDGASVLLLAAGRDVERSGAFPFFGFDSCASAPAEIQRPRRSVPAIFRIGDRVGDRRN